MSIQIVTDSTCDLSAETVQKLGITVLPLNIHIGETAYKEFYRQLPELHPFPKTASPGPGGFEQLYQHLADQGAKAILSIHISESLSATVNEARIAAGQFTRIPVTVLDSSQLSLGTGYLVEKAAQLAAAGQTIEEILSALKEQMERSYVFASLKTLEYLRRSGRMHSAVARIGEFIKLKPVLHMNMGKPVVHRTRTQKNATAQLLAWLEEYAPFEQLAILHAGVQEEAEALRESVRAYWPKNDVPVLQITPVLGAHLGIGALGFACISRK
jgi:DegV family protein with EDD domain